MGVLKGILDGGWCEVLDSGFDGDAGVDLCEAACGGLSLGHRFSGVGFCEQQLALQVAFLDVIAINDAEASHTGADEDFGVYSTEGPTAYESDVGGGEFCLPLFTDARKACLPRVTVRTGHML
ncbi:hypothetical protein F183_A01520 [Bryobacterales bacterium F-183]|nr:hypothetical protein F183_A01520 [Bryobacterales bacterium F-183]